MKHFLLLFFQTAFLLMAFSQEDSANRLIADVNVKTFSIGQSTVWLRTVSFASEPPFILLHLHSNEKTANEAAHTTAHQWGIPYYQLLNGQSRLVSFILDKKRFQFDPNRIFSDQGIKKTLRLGGRYTAAAYRHVKRISDSLLSALPKNRPVIAVHNNTDGRLTIQQYKDAGTKQVHINTEQDTDDFFITNDEEFYLLLKAEDFNVVLEDMSQVDDDGSLSLYCSRNHIRYINVEAEHGHLTQQLAMLAAVQRIFE